MSNGPEAAAEGTAGLHKPPAAALQKPGLLDQGEKPPFVHQALKILEAVAAKALVIEIGPKPGSGFPVKDIEGAGFGIAGHHYKQQHGAWEFESSERLRDAR